MPVFHTESRVHTCPSLFQATMEQVIQGIDGVICYLDDILVGGRTILERLDLAMTRLEERGLRLKVSNVCLFQLSHANTYVHNDQFQVNPLLVA